MQNKRVYGLLVAGGHHVYGKQVATRLQWLLVMDFGYALVGQLDYSMHKCL